MCYRVIVCNCNFSYCSDRHWKTKKRQKPTILVKFRYRHFDILMSQYNQVKTSHAFHGCAKIMLWLHAQRTKNPDTSQTHLSAFNFHEYHSDTSRHQPNIPKTSPGSIRCQQTKTDANRPHQTYSNSTCQCPGVSGAVCLCLLLSVVIRCHRKLPGEVWVVSGGCLVGVWRYLSGIHGTQLFFGGNWVLNPCIMEPQRNNMKNYSRKRLPYCNIFCQDWC